MNISHNKSLYDKLFLKIARMHDEVDYRMHLNAYHGQGGKWKDYPSVSIGAELDAISAIGHHHYYSREQDFHPLVLQGLTAKLGGLNDNSTHYPACNNKVGHCAENYAASKVLRAFDPHYGYAEILGYIHFTKAFRPRTWKNVEWCENCHTIFD